MLFHLERRCARQWSGPHCFHLNAVYSGDQPRARTRSSHKRCGLSSPSRDGGITRILALESTQNQVRGAGHPDLVLSHGDFQWAERQSLATMYLEIPNSSDTKSPCS
jgi:hypothetical protein